MIYRTQLHYREPPGNIQYKKYKPCIYIYIYIYIWFQPFVHYNKNIKLFEGIPNFSQTILNLYTLSLIENNLKTITNH